MIENEIYHTRVMDARQRIGRLSINVLDAEVDWKKDLANDPHLHLTAENIPTRDQLCFQGSRETGLWYGEHDSGKVEYFAWTGGQQDGYSGRHFDITTVDGESVTLKDQWSSRAGVMNKAVFGPCMDVVYESPDKGVTGTLGSVTVEKGMEAVDLYLDDVELERVEKVEEDEPYWIPVEE